MPQPLDSKAESLRQQGALNPHPQRVADPVFLRGEFFDPRDLVQVKYEMLRRVRVEGASITQVVSAFGFSRPVFYQAQALYHSAGLPGLIPQQAELCVVRLEGPRLLPDPNEVLVVRPEPRRRRDHGRGLVRSGVDRAGHGGRVVR